MIKINKILRRKLSPYLILIIQKIYQDIYIDKLLKIISKPKLNKTMKILKKSSETPKWLGWDELEYLQNKYHLNESINYEEQDFLQRAKYRAINLLKLIRTGRKKIKNFLELGCGHGVLCYTLQQMGINATGIDINFIVKKKIQNSRATFLKMDASDLKFEDDSFDFVYSFDVLEHILQPEKALQEAIRVVRKNGYIYIVFGLLYMSPWGPHAYKTITFPYWQFLFPMDLIKKLIKEKNLTPWADTTFNKWTIEEFRNLWKKYSNKVKIIKYKELLDLRYLDLIAQYPSCFRSKTKNFENLIVTSVEILLQKI